MREQEWGQAGSGSELHLLSKSKGLNRESAYTRNEGITPRGALGLDRGCVA
jgi:hypothetical protein